MTFENKDTTKNVIRRLIDVEPTGNLIQPESKSFYGKLTNFVTKSETVLSFRRGLIESLLQNGHSVGIIAHDDEQKDDILNLGVSFYCVEQDNRDLNPFAIIDYQKRSRRFGGV